MIVFSFPLINQCFHFRKILKSTYLFRIFVWSLLFMYRSNDWWFFSFPLINQCYHFRNILKRTYLFRIFVWSFFSMWKYDWRFFFLSVNNVGYFTLLISCISQCFSKRKQEYFFWNNKNIFFNSQFIATFWKKNKFKSSQCYFSVQILN